MKKYTLAEFVKGRVDDETLDRIALKADELQRENLSKEDKAIADRANSNWSKSTSLTRKGEE